MKCRFEIFNPVGWSRLMVQYKAERETILLQFWNLFEVVALGGGKLLHRQFFDHTYVFLSVYTRLYLTISYLTVRSNSSWSALNSRVHL